MKNIIEIKKQLKKQQEDSIREANEQIKSFSKKLKPALRKEFASILYGIIPEKPTSYEIKNIFLDDMLELMKNNSQADGDVMNTFFKFYMWKMNERDGKTQQEIADMCGMTRESVNRTLAHNRAVFELMEWAIVKEIMENKIYRIIISNRKDEDENTHQGIPPS